MSNTIEVYRSESTIDAQMKAHLLEQFGLHPTLLGENLASGIGMGGHAVPCRVFVPRVELERALTILADTSQNQQHNSPEEPTNCPACNAEWEPGFTVCWNCQTPL